MTRTLKALSILAVTGLAATIIGCSNSSDTTTPPPTKTTPGVGSTYTYDVWDYDSTANTSTPHTDSTYTVIADTLTMGGKTNVIAIQNADGNTDYYHMESNGDISKYLSVSMQGILTTKAVWITVPVASHTSQPTVTLLDSSITYSGFPIAVKVTATSSYLAPDSLSISNKMYAASKGLVTILVDAGIAENATVTSTIWYVPSIFFLGKNVRHDSFSGFALNRKAAHFETLTSFNVK